MARHSASYKKAEDILRPAFERFIANGDIPALKGALTEALKQKGVGVKIRQHVVQKLATEIDSAALNAALTQHT